MMCFRMLVVMSCVLLSVIGCSKDEGAQPSPAVPGSGTEAVPGEALVQKQCAICHTTERIDTANLDRAGWERTVDQMIDQGARLNEAERKIVIDYLSSR
jgi:cytochrome c5